MSERLGDRLRSERRARGESQRVCAPRFDISQPGYAKWETGVNAPAPHQYEAAGTTPLAPGSSCPRRRSSCGSPIDPTGETWWQLSQLSNAWRTVLGRATGRCRFHDLRHWHGSHLAGAGESPADGAAQLGHKQTSTFINMYAHPVDRSSASRIIGNLLERP